MANFTILSCANKDAARWQSLIDQLPLEYRDVFFTPAYARVQESIGQGPCFAALYEWDGSFILQPFMQRGGEVISFYGGGGPISDLMGAADYRLWLWFEQEFASWRKDCRITGEYTRLHPLFEKEQRRMLRESGLSVEHLREAVSVNLDLDNEALLKSFSRNRQRGIKEAIEKDCWVEPSHDLDQFGRLYLESMERLQAADAWKYPNRVWGTYSFELNDENLSILIGRSHHTVAMLLLIHGYGKAYAHFLATGCSANLSGLNDLLYFESMKYCRDIGCKTYFLGGGTTPNTDDPLLAYKSGFSKQRIPVYFYRRSFEGTHADSSTTQPAAHVEV